MSKVIKNGTIVTHDRTYKADVLVENGVIAEIGPDLKGDETLDASGCYVMPGGIDPHTHLEMPFMGTYSTDDFDSGTRAALAGGTTMVVDFALPSPGQGLLDALCPAVTAAEETAAQGFPETLAAVRKAATDGRDATVDMVAQIGRASRLGERSRGVQDAGATSCALILVTLADAIEARLS